MPDAIELLTTRRSVKPRDMSAQGPSPAQIDTLLTIAARVPDHGKIAPWRFIVFEGEARERAGSVIESAFVAKTPDATTEQRAAERARFMEAPLVIAIVSAPKTHPKVPVFEQELSAGASAMNLVTAATAMGYAANWLTGWFAFDADVAKGFGLTPPERIAGFIHIGGLKDTPEDRPRPDMSQIVTRF